MDKDYIYVDINDIKVSDDSVSVIGTSSLGPCFGVVLYDDVRNRAIVAHSRSDNHDLFLELAIFAENNGLFNDNIKYVIVPGFYETRNYMESKQILEEQFEKSGVRPLLNCDYCVRSLKLNDSNASEGFNEFLFDASSGKFVTNNYECIKNKNVEMH